MIKLYHAPRTRSVRVRWLLEELGLEHELARIDFAPGSTAFAQSTPMGKLPVIEDGDMVMCESGAILLYILERHGEGRLAPAIADPKRGEFLQWMSFAEGTAYPPLGVILWHSLYRSDADETSPVIIASRERARSNLDFLQQQLADKTFLLGDDFTAADIMMGFTLAAAHHLELLDERYSKLATYLARLMARPAFQRATEDM